LTRSITITTIEEDTSIAHLAHVYYSRQATIDCVKIIIDARKSIIDIGKAMDVADLTIEDRKIVIDYSKTTINIRKTITDRRKTITDCRIAKDLRNAVINLRKAVIDLRKANIDIRKGIDLKRATIEGDSTASMLASRLSKLLNLVRSIYAALTYIFLRAPNSKTYNLYSIPLLSCGLFGPFGLPSGYPPSPKAILFLIGRVYCYFWYRVTYIDFQYNPPHLRILLFEIFKILVLDFVLDVIAFRFSFTLAQSICSIYTKNVDEGLANADWLQWLVHVYALQSLILYHFWSLLGIWRPPVPKAVPATVRKPLRFYIHWNTWTNKKESRVPTKKTA
jgi:hypothetical protein